MKKLTMLCCGLLISIAMQAGTGINSDNNNSGASALSEKKSTVNESPVQRMTITQRNAISNPAAGLLVFCTDNNQIYTNIGTPENPKWIIKSRQIPSVDADLFRSWHRYSEDSKITNGC
jgi:outer membrane receptor for monomeric catechols